MYAKKMEETEGFELFGNRYRMYLPRDMTECLECGVVKMEKGSGTPAHEHPKEEQIYLVTGGRGRLRVGDEECDIEKGMIVFIPRATEHEVECISDEGLEYVYVAVWPGGVPQEERDWRKAYKLE